MSAKEVVMILKSLEEGCESMREDGWGRRLRPI